MASLIPGFEYDIFISYRQKDNKGDKQGVPSYGATQSREAGWVSEFVEALKDELESTFKEEISLYFDVNPHDGLLETHDVDASLKDKLKCLIFIPILSRTYCDPKAFGWDHEFREFIKNASGDQFGLKVKLPGGNVASRVLPIRIHDLDSADVALYESATGGVLRGVEFIYKSPGVNRPLRPREDKPQDNLNGTIYRDQINKVALAIKDIILGLTAGPVSSPKEKDLPKEPEAKIPEKEKPALKKRPAKPFYFKLLAWIAVLALLIIAAILIYPRIFKREKVTDLKSPDGRITVAVMPFQNMTNDTKLNVWQGGIQNELINSLTNSEELRIEPSESINGLLQSQKITNYASITPAVARKISAKLDANVFISGSINQSGSIIRINAQLTNSKTGDVLKSFKEEGLYINESILPIIDPLSVEIKSFLIISGLKEATYIDPQRIGLSDSPEAYRYFTYGQKAFAKGDFPEAINMLSQAVSIDTNLILVHLYIGWAYYKQGMYEEAKKWCLKAFDKRDLMSIQQKTYTYSVSSFFDGKPLEAIKYLKRLQEIDDQWPQLHYEMGCAYADLFQYDSAIPEFEKALEEFKEANSKPWWPANYTALGWAYHETGQYKKETKLYEKAERDFPDNPDIILRQAVLAFTEKNPPNENKFIEKYRSVAKENGSTESDIAMTLGSIYDMAAISEIALEYYKMALSLEPENPLKTNKLAYFLIEKDWNINEGLRLIEKALESHPDDYKYLHTKGWGLYKQGKYAEALEILQRSWDLRMQNAVYDHEAFLHLEAAKKAVMEQMDN